MFRSDEDVEALRFELGIALEGGVNGGVLIKLAGVVAEFTIDIKGDFHVLDIGVVHADELHETEERGAQIVFRSDQGRHGVGHLNLSLEYIESRNCPCIVTTLLVSDLGFVKGDLLLVRNHKGAVQDNLVELAYHVCHHTIESLTKLEVSDLLGKLGSLGEGRGLPSVIKKLGALEIDIP